MKCPFHVKNYLLVVEKFFHEFSHRYYPPQDGIFVVTASIRLVAESLIGGSIFTRVLSGDRLSGNVLGLYYGLTKTDYRQEITFTTNGMIRLLQANPLSFYIYMQNAGNYKILAGSRISVMKTETKYPAFHATLDANVSDIIFIIIMTALLT